MEKIVRIPVTQQVVSAIKDSILQGQFFVGQKLPSEMKLCEMLNVSRSSIREAMRVLQAEGYLELVAGKGAVVIDNKSHDYNTVRKWFDESASQLKDYTEIREVLEPLAVKLAIQRGTKKEMEKLVSIHQAFIDAEKEYNVTLLADLDARFHSTIAEMGHNGLLTKMNALLIEQLRTYRIRSISSERTAVHTIKEHQKIIDAMQKRDIDGAQHAMLDHLSKVKDKVQALS